MLISLEGTGKNRLEPDHESMGKCSSVVTLFFSKKSLTKTDRCAGALSRRRNQLLVLHFSGHFLLTSSVRRGTNLCNRNAPQAAITVNYTREFRELLKLLALVPVYHTARHHIFLSICEIEIRYRSVLAYVKGNVRDADCECVERTGPSSGRTMPDYLRR